MKTDNELIAEFMGLRPDVNGHYLITDFPHIHATCWCAPEYLDFHKSWDWLMPVIHKIKVSNPEAFKIDHVVGPLSPLAELYIHSPINEVYQSVVDFIKWYNSQGK